MRCPSLGTLSDYLRGLGVGPERAQIQEHLSGDCQQCRQNQKWLQEVQRVALLDDSFEFPASVTAHIVALMPKQPARTPLRTLLAQLLFDSFAPPQLAEVREAPVVDGQDDAFAGRQLLYQVEGFDVDLRLEKAADGHTYELIGQVLQQPSAASELAGYSVRMWADAAQLLMVNSDEEGMFRFTALSPDIYQISIVLPDAMIAIPELIIGDN